MIVSRILGGLGNQMFQHASGLGIADRLGTSYQADLSCFQNYALRPEGLSRLRIGSPVVSEAEYPITKRSGEGYPEERAGLARVKEASMRFDEGVFAHGCDLFLVGYWQNQRYFSSIRPRLVQEFSPVEPTASPEMLEEIQGSSSVAVHVRRGDYLQNPKVRRHFGVCTLDYYRMGVKLIAERVGGARFFVFSDDPEWARANLKLDATYVFGNSDIEDFRLMTACRHFIVANSSFSWWAAWLGQSSDKIVVAPDPWFISNRFDSSEIVPTGWIKIPGHSAAELLGAKLRGLVRK